MKNTKEKLVSCIIPTHNRSLLLKRAVESVINQNYKNLEIIVVNDGSIDDTEKVIEELKRQDPRIISLKNEQSKGPSAARNKGIKNATGYFIAFLDDDDQWLPNRISLNLSFLKEYDVSLCAPAKGYRNFLFHRCKEGLIKIEDFKKGSFLGTCFLMGHSYVFKEMQFDENLRLGEDWDLYIRVANKFKVGFLNRPLVILNDSGLTKITNETINMPIEQLEKRMSVIYKHETFLGPYWFDYHIARRLLSYIKFRDKRSKHIIYTVKRCGFFAVLRVFLDKIVRNVSKI
jgi:glycosyltransferase involved in cell wall biosynthesis